MRKILNGVEKIGTVLSRPRSWLTACGSLTMALLAVSSPQQAHAQLVVNGSFEADPCTGSGPGYKRGLSGSDLTGWLIPNHDSEYPWCLQNVNAFNAGPAADGNQWLVLGRTSTASHYTIQQTLTGLTPGSTYNLGFSIASEGGAPSPGPSAAQVSFSDGGTLSQTFIAPFQTSGGFWNPWGAFSMSFVPIGSDVTFQFMDVGLAGLEGNDLGLDAVHAELVTTPEPASTTLLATGLVGVYGVARRRRKAASAA